MRHGLWLVLLAGLTALPLAGQEAESDQDLMDFLNTLEADKDVETKYRASDDKPEGQPAEPRRSPMEILSEASRKMDVVVKELTGEERDREQVVEEQREVVKLLDELLDMASRGGGGGGGAQSPSGGQTTVVMPPPDGGGGQQGQGGGGSGKPSDERQPVDGQDGEQWGELPERVREEVLQILQEDVPLLYRELLRLYFKNIDKE